MNISLDENTGDFLSGTIIPTKQKSHGIAYYDRTNAAIKAIKELCSKDFPNSPLVISKDGKITKRNI